MGVNPHRKSGVEPRRRLVEQRETFRQLLQLRWHRPYRLVLSVGPYQQRREGDPGDWAHQDFHIFRPGLHLERSLQLRWPAWGFTATARGAAWRDSTSLVQISIVFRDRRLPIYKYINSKIWSLHEIYMKFGIAKATGSNPVEALIFFRLLLYFSFDLFV